MPVTPSKVNFHFLKTNVSLSNRSRLKTFIEKKIFGKEKRKLKHLSYIFCSDDFLLNINKQYLKHDFYTDIITFDLSEDKEIFGEIYISIDRIRENAKTFNSSILLETHRVIFHGALHLIGYDDKTPRKKTEMISKEDYYLNKYFR